MELYLDIYETADKGIASNVVLDDQTVLEIQKKVKDAGYPIATMVTYSNMENYESVDSFLKECMEGKRGSTFFGTSLPEVVDIKENQDGTVTLTVEAVCDMVICDDAVITHELTVRFAEDGSFQYLGNEILNDGIMHIPDYQYRIKE